MYVQLQSACDCISMERDWKVSNSSNYYRLETESSCYLKGIVCYYFQSNFPEF